MIIDETKRLIDAMSMNEKRYFKLFVNRSVFGEENKYLLLFDIFNKSIELSETFLKESMKRKKFSDKNISYDLNYLNKILLRSLNEFHFEKTISLKIQNYIKSVEILFYKGLYEDCLKIIQKAKKISKKNENEILFLELLNWEKKCIGYSKGFLGAMQVNDKIEAYFSYIKENQEITHLYYHSYFLKNNVGKAPFDKISKEFEIIVTNKLLQKKETEFHSIQSNIFYHLIFANYYNLHEDTQNELLNLEKTIEIFDLNLYYKQENPLDYISVYIRIIDIYKKSDSISFYNKIEGLRKFDNILDFQKRVAKERIFFHTYQAELEYSIFNNRFEKCIQTTQLVVNSINENKYKIEPYYYIGMYYQFACVMLIDFNISKCLKYINIIRNEYHLEDRPKTFLKTEILNLIVHFELKNYRLVLHNAVSFTKKYKRVFKPNFIENKLIELITKVSENPYLKNETAEFSTLYNKIVKNKDIEESVSNKIYIKYIEMKTTKTN